MCICLCVGVYMSGVLVEVMVQLVGFGSPLHHVDPGDGTQFVQLGGKLLSLLNYFIGPP